MKKDKLLRTEMAKRKHGDNRDVIIEDRKEEKGNSNKRLIVAGIVIAAVAIAILTVLALNVNERPEQQEQTENQAAQPIRTTDGLFVEKQIENLKKVYGDSGIKLNSDDFTIIDRKGQVTVSVNKKKENRLKKKNKAALKEMNNRFRDKSNKLDKYNKPKEESKSGKNKGNTKAVVTKESLAKAISSQIALYDSLICDAEKEDKDIYDDEIQAFDYMKDNSKNLDSSSKIYAVTYRKLFKGLSQELFRYSKENKEKQVIDYLDYSYVEWNKNSNKVNVLESFLKNKLYKEKVSEKDIVSIKIAYKDFVSYDGPITSMYLITTDKYQIFLDSDYDMLDMFAW